MSNEKFLSQLKGLLTDSENYFVRRKSSYVMSARIWLESGFIPSWNNEVTSKQTERQNHN